MSSDSTKHSKQRAALVERLQFLGQMGSTETALFHQKAAEIFGLGITDMKAVSTLMQEGPVTAGQLAKRLSLTTGAITNLIDRLEERGIAKRMPDPEDRRKVIVKANPKMIEHGSSVYESMGKAHQQLLDDYSTKELAFLVKYHEKQLEMTKQEIAKLANRK